MLPKSSKRIYYTPSYEVDLIPRQVISKPEEIRKEEIKPVEKPEPVKPVKKEEPKVQQAKPNEKKVKEQIKIAKAPKEAVKPEDAIAKMREKLAAEDAIEKMRKKVREKEAAKAAEIKIAEKAPAKVYRYEDLDEELKAYFDKISSIIREAWHLPEALKNKGHKTVVSIHVLKDGTVESLWVEEGSGNKLFDDTTIRAINKVTPLPPLPRGWKGEYIDLGFILRG